MYLPNGSSGKTSNWISRSALFVSRTRHRQSIVRSLLSFTSVSLGMCRDSTLNSATATSFHILSNWLFTKHHQLDATEHASCLHVLTYRNYSWGSEFWVKNIVSSWVLFSADSERLISETQFDFKEFIFEKIKDYWVKGEMIILYSYIP
jgi:hypothetical protein